MDPVVVASEVLRGDRVPGGGVASEASGRLERNVIGLLPHKHAEGPGRCRPKWLFVMSARKVHRISSCLTLLTGWSWLSRTFRDEPSRGRCRSRPMRRRSRRLVERKVENRRPLEACHHVGDVSP